MPISYKVDHEKGLICTNVSGKLTIQKTIEYFEQVQSDDSIPHDAIEIVDFDRVDEFTISYGDMKAITQNYQSAKSQKNILATIFVARTSLSFGVARMLQMLHEIANKEHIVSVVRSDEELNQKVKELRLIGSCSRRHALERLLFTASITQESLPVNSCIGHQRYPPPPPFFLACSRVRRVLTAIINLLTLEHGHYRVGKHFHTDLYVYTIFSDGRDCSMCAGPGQSRSRRC